MIITINTTSFDIYGDPRDIKEFLKNIHPADTHECIGYHHITNLKLYKHLPQVHKAIELKDKQLPLFKGE
jgi:hypothetical protein